MADIRVPKLNNNDAEYLLVEWLVEDGAPIRSGDPMVIVETSKAAEELTAEESGHLHHGVPAGTWCRPAQSIAHITASAAAPARREPAAVPGPAVPEADGPLITEPARALMNEMGITEDAVRALGVAVVRRTDVERLAVPPARPADTLGPAGGKRRPLSRVQRAVGRAVETSHQTIPAAYTAVRMDLGPLLARATRLTRETRRPVGLAELFVMAVAETYADHPMFFATLTPDGTAADIPDAPHIGVTVDAGEGLYVPVVHDAARMGVKELATLLMKYRVAAAGGEFTERELSGAGMVITLHTEPDVVLAIPYVLPGTACALAVTPPSDGTRATIGIAYDHRLINGRDAALYMGRLKQIIETPETA
ncbi:dehydrogenase [Spongiactinospora gelatinilytica]|uniref:Dihydrolipoamide acetyltransferase component of pyruvate dehydrogenase complex n=1 Tax=Spongiactinospora gelatinilytica TaxID=2666298 RepID=A0A2W2J556_9ACTN|nr:2-oxo acid dehydrogenase subunit E2 [Spongiactinospora gelatinilytica]PZG56754.1 dehydrogenase [Spongiactinospora gelatinilytica]